MRIPYIGMVLDGTDEATVLTSEVTD